MSIEAMKQALEALESYHGYMEPLTTVFGGPRVPAEQSTTGKVEKAITSLRQAIAEAEKQEPAAIATGVYGGRFTYVTNTPNVVFPDGTAFYTHPQPKREPEAWTPRIERHYKDGVLISQTIQYNPQGEKLPYPHEPKREPIACVIDGKLMAYKNGPLPDNCLLYDQAL